MTPRIETISSKQLIGMHMNMSLSDNKTFELWKTFMPRKKEIRNNLTSDLISMQVYPPDFRFKDFTLETRFEKWAAVEVKDNTSIPDGMESFTLPGGLYAVFLHKGAGPTAQKTFQYIFGTWLPSSGYKLDGRPHFEVMGEKYKNDQPDSEEEIWIPIGIK